MRLRDWDADEDLAFACLCHATYGTDGFTHHLNGWSDRDESVELIGATATTIVYRYASCGHHLIDRGDRRIAERVPVARGERDVAEVIGERDAVEAVALIGTEDRHAGELSAERLVRLTDHVRERTQIDLVTHRPLPIVSEPMVRLPRRTSQALAHNESTAIESECSFTICGRKQIGRSR